MAFRNAKNLLLYEEAERSFICKGRFKRVTLPHLYGSASKVFVEVFHSCNPALLFRLHGMKLIRTDVLSFHSVQRRPKNIEERRRGDANPMNYNRFP